MKTAAWTARPGRKLRVVFVDDAFWGYVDLPEVRTAQRKFEDTLRASTNGTVSLYKPGSAYRDAVTPALNASNLHFFQDVTLPPSTSALKIPPASPRLPAVPERGLSARRTRARPSRADAADRYSHWWAALPAVPASPAELDWWSAPDGRASRYERLKRVWFDTTRNFWFYTSDQEDHLTATLWENLAIWHPSVVLPKLFEAAGLEPPVGISDAAWSYEFEERVEGHLKQIDVVLHFRDARGDALLIVEAKRPKGPLKPSDHNAAYYLDLPSFQFTPRRHAIYLVDEADLPAVRSIVGSTATTKPGFLSWQEFGKLQVALASSLRAPEHLRELAACLIRWQFERHGFNGGASGPAYPSARASLHELLDANERHLPRPVAAAHSHSPADRTANQIRLALTLDIEQHIKTFVAGAIQHQACTCGATPSRLAWDYLAQEPSRDEIIPGMAGRQRTAERLKALWRMPPQEGQNRT